MNNESLKNLILHIHPADRNKSPGQGTFPNSLFKSLYSARSFCPFPFPRIILRSLISPLSTNSQPKAHGCPSLTQQRHTETSSTEAKDTFRTSCQFLVEAKSKSMSTVKEHQSLSHQSTPSVAQTKAQTGTGGWNLPQGHFTFQTGWCCLAGLIVTFRTF